MDELRITIEIVSLQTQTYRPQIGMPFPRIFRVQCSLTSHKNLSPLRRRQYFSLTRNPQALMSVHPHLHEIICYLT